MARLMLGREKNGTGATWPVSGRDGLFGPCKKLEYSTCITDLMEDEFGW